MRQDINPCDDFFEYACGSWNKINVIPEDRSGYNTFAKLRDDLQVILKGIVLYLVCIQTSINVNHVKYHDWKICRKINKLFFKNASIFSFFFNGWSKKIQDVFLGLIAIFCDTLHTFFDMGLSNYNFKISKIKICMYSFNDFVET